MTQKSVQASFAAGEVSPAIAARVDLAKRQIGVETLENFFVRVSGSVDSRPGQRFVAECKDRSTDVRLIPFEFNSSQTYVIELGNLYARFHTQGAQILESATESTITAATQASPVVITTSGAHGYSSGDEVYITGVSGMTELNGRNFQVTVLSTTTFSLQDLGGSNIDGSAYTAYSADGTATKVYELATPWSTADLREIRFSQNADILTLAHPDYEVRELIRAANDNWTLSVVTFTPETSSPTGLDDDVKSPAADSQSITGITKASPAVVTTGAAHGWATGDKVYISGVNGMSEVNHDLYTITVASATTFSIERFRDGGSVNSTGFNTYTSGGTVRLAPLPRRYTVTALNEDSGEESLPAISSFSLTVASASSSDPVVIMTSDGHGLYTGDVVYISGVGGMTEINGQRFIITRTDETTFSLRWLDGTDVDGSAFGAFTSGGTVNYTWTVAWGSGDGSDANNEWDNVVSWGVVTGATRYVVYSTSTLGGTLGYLGTAETLSFRDDNIAPDQSRSHPRGYNPFADYDGGGGDYPVSVGHYEQRRVFGGTTNAPNTVYMTKVGALYNFSRATPLRDDDSIIQSIASLRLDSILHILPLSDLILLTAGGEHRVFATDGPITPSTAQVKPQSFHGSTDLRPIVAGDNGLFLSRGQYVRDFTYDFSSDKFLGKDLSVLSRHLFDGYTLTDWDWSTSPYGLVHAVRSDGTGLVFTYQPEQDVFAWSRSTTKGKYISTSSIREGDYDIPYFVVRRTVGGETVQFIERGDTRLFTRLEDAFCVDAGLTYAGTDYAISDYVASSPVRITATGHGLVDGDTVDIVDVMQQDSSETTGEAPATVINGTGYTVANATANTFELQIEGADYDGSAAAAYSSGGTVRKAVTTVSGLWHLEGETVVAAANGYAETGLTVSGGAVTLSAAASRIHVGLPYTCRLKTLQLERYGDGLMRGRTANVSRLTVQVLDTMGLWYGPSTDQMREHVFGLPSQYGQPLTARSGDLQVTLKADWGKDKRIVIEQRSPLPMTIAALVPDIQLGGN